MQTTITLSSCEAEYVTLTTEDKETLWIKSLLSEIGFPQQPVPIHIDNKGERDLDLHQRISLRTKHIDLQYHWIREQVQQQ